MFLVWAVVLVLLAGGLAAADSALTSFSRARAEELLAEARPGSRRLLALLDDRAPYLNTVILLRLLCEFAATVLVLREALSWYAGHFWAAGLTTVAAMLVVSFVAIGVAPRTLGRQHADRVALWTALPVTWVTSVLGPVPRLLILIGNAVTPGTGFREGPFSTETELRELVDIAEATALIEARERTMIHGVFELGDTTVREVMVPRGDVVFVERHKNLRQTMSLFLRSGYSRVPVVDDDLDHTVGLAYLKDVVRRDFEAPDVELTQRIDEVMRPVTWVPESKPIDALLAEMQARRQHIAMVVDEYGGTAGLVTIEDLLEEIVGEITDEYDVEQVETQRLADGSVRVSARYPVDDLPDLFEAGVVPRVDEEDVDSVGGLMAKHLGLVPIPGSQVVAHGLRFSAEDTAGRRNKVVTVRISRFESPGAEVEESVPKERAGDAHE